MGFTFSRRSVSVSCQHYFTASGTVRSHYRNISGSYQR